MNNLKAYTYTYLPSQGGVVENKLFIEKSKHDREPVECDVCQGEGWVLPTDAPDTFEQRCIPCAGTGTVY